MSEGFTGTQIGEALNSMLNAVLDDKLENKYDKLLEFAKNGGHSKE